MTAHNSGFGEILVEVTRAGLVESEHKGHLVILGSDGAVSFAAGDIDANIFPRSTVKALQASAMVRHGLKLSPEQLAMAQSSHSGAPEHLEVVRSILALAQLDESYLRNAQDRPLGTAERAAWGDNPATRLAHNCSGKHASMLLTCVINGWPLENYLEPTHPLQKAIINEITTLSGRAIDIITADGCGAPLFAMSTRSLATSIHAITVSQDPVHQEVLAAARAYPFMLAGKGRTTTVMMERIPGLYMKDGIEAVEVFSLTDGRTCAMKIADGGLRPLAPLNSAVLASWGIDAQIEPVLIYGGSQVVGEVKSRLHL